jgi:serine/threonine protein kinase
MGASHDRGVSEPTETVYVPDGPIVSARPTRDGPLPRLGRYQTLAQVGTGAMGAVYRAYDDTIGRPVAIKALYATGDAELRARFVREARAIGAVQHPNILAVFDACNEGGTQFLVMELATGGSLRDHMTDGPMEVRAVREVGIQIARALEATHAADIIHRDVKPANILARGDTWKLADFGVAKLPDSTITAEGKFIGSPSYAAPESLRDATYSPASDVYSLAATLYEALAGVPPHGDHELLSIARKIEQDPHPLPRGPVGDAIMAGLARDPAHRPSAAELASLLARDEEPIVITRPSRALKTLAILFALAAIVAVAFAVNKRARGSSEAKAAPAPTTPLPKPAPYNELDEKTAKELLDLMERDARKQIDKPKKRKKKKKRLGFSQPPDPITPTQPAPMVDPWRL